MTNHNRAKQRNQPMITYQNLQEMHLCDQATSKTRLVLLLLLFSWKSDVTLTEPLLKLIPNTRSKALQPQDLSFAVIISLRRSKQVNAILHLAFFPFFVLIFALVQVICAPELKNLCVCTLYIYGRCIMFRFTIFTYCKITFPPVLIVLLSKNCEKLWGCLFFSVVNRKLLHSNVKTVHSARHIRNRFVRLGSYWLEQDWIVFSCKQKQAT